MTARKGLGFPKAARIRRRREFLSMGQRGEKRRTPHFVLVTERCSGTPRLGITVSRKVGGAVRRNRLKRRIREIYRRERDRIDLGQDLVVIAKIGAAELESAEIQRELVSAVGRRLSSSFSATPRS
jgi:ribonuclease P protein component